jgi:2-polyprenyl-3-methyl-5-hydroxy-6-metoxy-1,4-benzoquinol methylase
MTELDVHALERAGFTVVEKQAVDYTDSEMAKDYLKWGFKPKEQVEAEAVFAAEQMGLQPEETVVDIGCGNGVAAAKLAESGIRVTALDISPVFVEAGKKWAHERGVAEELVSWVVADFFSWEAEPHDAALLLDPGIDVANEEFAAKIGAAVKPGGKFFLRYKQGSTGASNLPWREWRYERGAGRFVLEAHSLDRVAGKNTDEWITIDFAQKEVVVERSEGRVALFSQFAELMGRAGLELENTWAGVDGAPVTENSRIYAMFRRVE